MPNRTGFQSFVNDNLPIGIPGDWASANPRSSVIGGPGAFIAPPAGTTVGVFAWFDPVTALATNYYKPNAFLAFVHRQKQALITQFLGIASQQIVPGNMVSGHDRGDFLAQFVGAASVLQKVYADPVTGACTAAATGGSVTGTDTSSTVTGSVLAVTTADTTGTAPAVGQAVTGGTIPEGTSIASSAGSGGGVTSWNLVNANGTAIPNQGAFTSVRKGVQETTYTVALPVAADATTDTGAISTAGVLTVAGTITGVFTAGQFVSGAGIPVAANAQILQILTGTGGAGTYQLSYSPSVAIANEAITATAGKVGSITNWN